MRVYRVTLLIVFILGLFWAGLSPGALQKFYAQGVAPYVEGDAKVRDRALEDFKQQVLLQAIMEIIGPDAVKENEGLINKNILSQPDKFINAYRIISETVAGGLFRISGEAEISRQLLEDELNALGLIKPSATTAPQSEYESGSSRSILWRDQSSCGEYGNEFSKLLMDSLIEKGWTINDDRAKNQPRWVIISSLACPEGTGASYITGTVEVRDGANESIKAVISERVQKEAESPMLEAVISLADLIQPQLAKVIEPGESAGERENLPKADRVVPADSAWEVTIPDYPCLAGWERLEKVLADMNLNFRVSRMAITAKECKIRLEGVSSSFPEYLREVEGKQKMALKVEYLDPASRLVTLRISDNVKGTLPGRNQ